MKRFFVVMGLILFSFALAGCDLISDDVVEKATEELCRENPEHELCQADVFEQLEDDAMIDYFDELLVVLEDETNQTFCEDYFSVTNITLLDECISDRNLLIPTDIANFVAISVTKDGDYYTIETLNEATNEIVEFEVRIVLEDDRLRINDWTFLEPYLAGFVIEQEHIDSGLEMFIEDFRNEMISDEDFCSMWFDGIDEDCDGVIDARRKFKAGAALSKTVNIADIGDVEDDTVEAKIEFFFDGHVTVLKIALSITLVEGVVTYEITEETILLRGIDESKIRLEIDMFIEDYSDPDITDEELCAKWYDGEDNDCDGLIKARVKFKAGADLSKKVNIVDDDDDDFGDVTAVINFEHHGHVTVLKIAFDVSEEDGILRLMIKEEGVLVRGFNEEDIIEEIEKFMVHFESGDIPTEQLCSMWFNAVDNDCDGIEEARRRFKAGADLAKKVNIIAPDVDDDEMIYATIEYEHNGHVNVLRMTFTVTEEDEVILLSVRRTEVEGDYRTFIETEIVSMYRMYLVDYFDSSITFEELNNMYFDNKMDSEFGRLRELDIENIIVVNVLNDSELTKDDMGYFILSLEIVTNNGNKYEEISLKPIRLELSRVDLNPGVVLTDYYSISEVEEYFRIFLADYLDPDSDDDTIDDVYFGGNLDPSFLVERSIFLSSGTTISMTGISARSNYNIDSFFDVFYEIRTGDVATTDKVKIKVNRIDMALVLDPDDDGDSVPTESLRTILEDFINLYNDPTIDNQEVCVMIAQGGDGTTCESTRTSDILDENTITSYELFGDPDFGFDDTFLFGDPDFLYSVSFLFGDPDFDVYRTFTIEVVLGDDGNFNTLLTEIDNPE
ncbi:Protein metal binding site [Candidatus Izimaplasma bacterium HR1]|uniref:hypothetical protein n=1 Tax=Candidatus Izimoplasma sp. HR1 TaxID=1541959 RepID=UPI0004F85668|nr:Protein metal binding site [Candidatus Izimaplasma bacterium HR1]